MPQNLNYFGLTKFGSKIMLSPIKFCVPKDMSGLQNILGPKKYWPKKKFQSQKFFGSLIILGSNFFSAWMANILCMLSWQYSSRCEFFSHLHQDTQYKVITPCPPSFDCFCSCNLSCYLFCFLVYWLLSVKSCPIHFR